MELALLRSKFEKYISKDVDSGCWLWIGGLFQTGYGETTLDGRKRAHRLSWEIYQGPIPDRLLVLHKCDVKRCVNPDHLYLGDNTDNALDAVVRKANFKSAQTHCLKGGHLLSGDNLRVYNGRRICITCQRERTNNWWDAHGVEYRKARKLRTA